MKTIFFGTAALLLIAAPGQAQLLGGGSLGGQLGGTLRGAGSLDLPIRSVETVTRGTGAARGETRGTQTVDRKSGRVAASRSAEAEGSGSLDQSIGASVGNLGSSVAGRGEGRAEAQLLGTDAVRGLAGSAVGTARGAASAGREITGAVAGSGSAAASGVFSGAAGQLALAGSAAGQAAGSFDIARGMPVSDDDGERIGTVSGVLADARGQVQQVVVMTDDGAATVPAANFTGEGALLISAMSEGKLEKTARRQEKQRENPDRAD